MYSHRKFEQLWVIGQAVSWHKLYHIEASAFSVNIFVVCIWYIKLSPAAAWHFGNIGKFPWYFCRFRAIRTNWRDTGPGFVWCCFHVPESAHQPRVCSQGEQKLCYIQVTNSTHHLASPHLMEDGCLLRLTPVVPLFASTTSRVSSWRDSWEKTSEYLRCDI